MPETNTEKISPKPTMLWSLACMLGNVVFIAILLFMSAMVFSLVKGRITGTPPSIAGYQMYIVLSGSMGPTFEAGSVVFVRPLDPIQLEAGDIITYRGNDGSETLTTHRVMEVVSDGTLSFVTKGDANDVVDGSTVPAANIVGRVHYSVPYLGHLMAFTQTKKGLVLLVIAPGLLIILFELKNLFSLATAMEEEKKAKANNEPAV
ncbi:MAG: signal peptidase I [Clostridiales bacterium]|jgi:signal peptidase|nr:signal peptidase I [Clostridiales bacterium]